ncbi:MAG: crossover junction endodeoxyribonuclease RuvC [Lachnospiraceae bacterium]|nr:crossover junction endodeoxyribonuclease RuvC [Ruminococcus sp.]MCM1277001.1 crossover junction endodeoxyribonuclease RuvC [Lachnospiraceae bacterium]
MFLNGKIKRWIKIKILSLDQATNKSGIAVHCDGKLVLHDLIDLGKQKVNISERVFVMADRIYGYIKKQKPDFVVIEDVAMQTNAATLVQLARLQGAIIGYCRVKKVSYDILKPSSWRKILGFKQGQGIKRPELKKQAVEYVKDIYNLDLSEDVCEAVCIGDAFLKLQSNEM